MFVPLNRQIWRAICGSSAIYAEVRLKARPPPIPDLDAAASSPSPGCRVFIKAAVVSPSATAALFCLKTSSFDHWLNASGLFVCAPNI
jgi:hypothetical protein